MQIKKLANNERLYNYNMKKLCHLKKKKENRKDVNENKEYPIY